MERLRPVPPTPAVTFGPTPQGPRVLRRAVDEVADHLPERALVGVEVRRSEACLEPEADRCRQVCSRAATTPTASSARSHRSIAALTRRRRPTGCVDPVERAVVGCEIDGAKPRRGPATRTRRPGRACPRSRVTTRAGSSPQRPARAPAGRVGAPPRAPLRADADNPDGAPAGNPRDRHPGPGLARPKDRIAPADGDRQDALDLLREPATGAGGASRRGRERGSRRCLRRAARRSFEQRRGSELGPPRAPLRPRGGGASRSPSGPRRR